MAKGIRLLVWGDYALFTRPEMKAERVSYDFMTPSAARAIVSAIYWKPQISWVVDKIHILKPIQFTSVRRNEVASKAVTPSATIRNGTEAAIVGIAVDDNRQQRASLILKDVSYLIEAHFELRSCAFEQGKAPATPEDCAAKHIAMFTRRAAAGQYFSQPYFGCREFPAYFRLLMDDEMPPCELPESQKNKDFGIVFHDFLFHEDKNGKVIESNTGKKLTAEPCFFHAVAQDGVVTVPKLEHAEEQP